MPTCALGRTIPTEGQTLAKILQLSLGFEVTLRLLNYLLMPATHGNLKKKDTSLTLSVKQITVIPTHVDITHSKFGLLLHNLVAGGNLVLKTRLLVQTFPSGPL